MSGRKISKPLQTHGEINQQTFQDGVHDVTQTLQRLTEKTILLPLKHSTTSCCETNAVNAQRLTL